MVTLRAQEYDPWSAGRPRVSVDFIRNLDAEAEERRLTTEAEERADRGVVTMPQSVEPTAPAAGAAAAGLFADFDGLARSDAKVRVLPVAGGGWLRWRLSSPDGDLQARQEAMEAQQLQMLFSLCRHGKYAEIDEVRWAEGVLS